MCNVGVVVLVLTMVVVAESFLGIPDFLEMGGCAKITLFKDFDPVKYSGLWFDIESVPNEYQHPKKCITQNYTWAGDSQGDYMVVSTKGLTTEDDKVRQGAVMHVELEATGLGESDPAHMTVTATGVPEAPYQILDTDYRTYSCVYSCLEYFGFRAEFAWVFGRTPTLPATTRARCHHKLTDMGVDYEKMVPIVQGETCPYNEKLDEMLGASEKHLLELLGPFIPTTTTTSTTTTTTTTPRPAQEEEVDDVMKMVEEEREEIEEMKTEIKTIDKRHHMAQDESDTSSSNPVGTQRLPLLLLLLLTIAA